MRHSSWKNLFCTALLLPAAVTADDATSGSEQDASAHVTDDAVMSLAEYESRWRLGNAVDTNTYFDRMQSPSSPFQVNVDDGSSIMRVAKIRSLSFFTFAGDEQSKWFLGVNEDGLVGVHFRGFTRESAKRHVDLASLLAADKDDDNDD